MSFISVIPPEQADERLAHIYRQVAGPGGQVDQVLQVHGLRPHGLEGHMALYKSALHHRDNEVPEWFLEAIGVLVSRLNGCDYCDRHHTVGMLRLLGGATSDYDRALNDDPPGSPFTRAEQSALQYAAKLTREPAAIEMEDVVSLRDNNWSDGQILEINQAASYFAYANRTVSGLGVTTAGEALGFSPSSDSDKESWKHG
ncbi:MAG: alkylhydroperoxidase [Gammaproteobacteria bacterium]|nr:alkylhydroperoxidase [Gammaproteobacteria bacterium]